MENSSNLRLARIEQLLNQSRWKDAEQAIRDLLEVFPNNLRGKFYLAVSAFGRGRLLDAERLILNVLEENPNVVQFHLLLAKVVYSQEQFSRAGIVVDDALRINPLHPTALCIKAMVLFVFRKNEEGLRVLNQAISLSPQDTVIINYKAAVLESMSKGEGDDLIKVSLNIDPMEVSTIGLDGKRLLRNGENAQAVIRLEEAMSINPNNEEVRTLLLQAYRKTVRGFGWFKYGEGIFSNINKFFFPLMLSFAVMAIAFCLVFQSAAKESSMNFGVVVYISTGFLLHRPLVRGIINSLLLFKPAARILLHPVTKARSIGAVVVTVVATGLFIYYCFYPSNMLLRASLGLLVLATLSEALFYSESIELVIAAAYILLILIGLIIYAVYSGKLSIFMITLSTYLLVQMVLVGKRVDKIILE